MGLVSTILYAFTPYTDASERAVGVFFKGLTEHGNQSRMRTRLNGLLQRNIAVINLWTEYRYKGYKYLRKSQRRKLYTNLRLIAEDFERFCVDNTQPADIVVAHIHKLMPGASVDPDRAVRLQALLNYFSPLRGIYEYHKSSSFGRLLRDPSRQKLAGDCNQIVTLYIYLYSRYFDVHDLQIRILPGHVALHYAGIDIEATSGAFVDYSDRKGGALLPIEEIVSINLLDTTDSYLSTHEVAPEDFLQASRLAFILSHERDIATHNLDAAYSDVINSLMERNNYSQALKFATASHNMTLLSVVGHNGAIYEMEHHNYNAARRFAKHALKRDELIKDCWRSEGFHYYQAGRYHNAIKAFKHISDRAGIRQCYEALFFDEQKKLGSVDTESIKKHRGTVKRMRTYAKKSGNKQLIEHTDTLNKYL